jgi:hypothetical protein
LPFCGDDLQTILFTHVAEVTVCVWFLLDACVVYLDNAHSGYPFTLREREKKE